MSSGEGGRATEGKGRFLALTPDSRSAENCRLHHCTGDTADAGDVQSIRAAQKADYLVLTCKASAMLLKLHNPKPLVTPHSVDLTRVKTGRTRQLKRSTDHPSTISNQLLLQPCVSRHAQFQMPSGHKRVPKPSPGYELCIPLRPRSGLELAKPFHEVAWALNCEHPGRKS